MVTDNFINVCKDDAYENRLGKVVVDGILEEITQDNNLSGFTVNSGCYVDGSIIGSVYVKSANCQFVDLNDVDLVDKSIQLSAGVLYDDGTEEYINLGSFVVEKPKDEKTSDSSSITAYDYLLNNLDKSYVCGIDYTEEKTVADLYADVCNQLGLEPKTLEFLNSDIPIMDNPFTNDEKNRFVLQTIGKVACSFVEIDADTNQIDLVWLSENSEPNYIFDEDDYSTFEGGDVTLGPINSVTIKNSQVDDENVTKTDDESIAVNGEHSIVISEDYILYDADLRATAIEKIYERLKGLTYVNCKLVTYYGKPFLKIGDKIQVIYNGINYDTYVLMHTFTYDGTFQSTIESPVLTAQQVATKQDTSLGEKLRNVQAIVNKQEGKIQLLVEEVENIELETLYTWIKYADDESGTNISSDSTGKAYIGIAYNKVEPTASNNPSDYTWSKIQGEKGETGEQGPQGEKGDTGEQGPTGATGRGIQATAITYQTSASGTTVPTGTWNTTISSVSAGQYLWTRTIITYSDNTTTTSYSVGRSGTNGSNGTNGTNGADGKDGEDGRGISSTVITYQVGTSGTTTPTGTWSSSVPSASAGQYIWTRTVITYTDNTTSTSYSVSKYGNDGKDVAIQSDTAPEDTTQMWLDTNTNQLKVWDGQNWIVVNDFADDLDILEGQVTEIKTTVSDLTETAKGIEITVSDHTTTIGNLNGEITTIKGDITSMTHSFTTKGLAISQDGETINSLLDNAGLKIYNLEKLIAIFNKNGSGVEKLIAIESIQLQHLLLKKATKETQRHGTIPVISGYWQDVSIQTLDDLKVVE